MDYRQANTGNSMEVDLQSNSMEVDGSVLAEVVTQTIELIGGVVEAVAEVTVSRETKQGMFPGAGQLYEEGKHRGKILGDGFVDIGGFDVPKTEASLYKEIWLNYGHIASNRVLPDSYYFSQVTIVSELMSVIVKMNGCTLEEVSSEVIGDWEKNIRVAEKLEFNIGWLRQRLEDIKIVFSEDKKLQEIVAEQDEAKARVIEAEKQLFLEKERLSALETKIPPLLVAKQNFRNKCGGPLLLFNGGASLSPVTAPVQDDAILTEEPMPDNNNSKRGPPTGIAGKIRFISSLNK
ncbi:hypothetical protein C5167_041079 [Papaver somniferum]|uniref:Uncharacterized protein n=1 Tax=Papaver somniferum TaxID=3469 RepID=A0A4Y7IGS6_PAPSO|nr:MATH domain and coiled-coil domain-containing protein At3g44790-like [Papaver somniferum]RZC48113.1 hypothetical protein C5167_041079 [Papaver somniferum]